ncbi:MAG TPA: medium chain dehydrogenase/reductase family protein [Rhodopila sp.]|uniref:medium chain dehydrogenase/reductase family protein n=1 Tax=Rhodopila sp. TaxID=2480087 RepID=UPI002C8A62AF|nr:medium chain dehydrogenase/reductase family protein [Rhodopila sp.]HVY16018.1 medium chain dehydrogenase/reductase family protein [Rhodopila sp.]
MKAVWLETTGSPLQIVDRPEPKASPDGVVVAVRAVRVPSYTRQVVDGTLGYDLPTPLVPGPACIGRIEQTGSNVFGLKVGQWVLCNSLLSSGDVSGSSDEILIGWTGNGTARSQEMQRAWRHGSFAEMAHYPETCLTPLLGAEAIDIARLPFLASLAIAAGGLDRGELSAGQTVIVNGATGQLGSAAILFALARGAARVVAVGRNADKLKSLAQRSRRIESFVSSGERGRDAARLRELCGGGADLVADYLGRVPSPAMTLAAIDALKVGGTAVLVGGVRHDLGLPYSDLMRKQLTVRGSFMFSRETALECWRLVQTGVIDLASVQATCFRLDEIEKAMDDAAERGGFEITVLLPTD